MQLYAAVVSPSRVDLEPLERALLAVARSVPHLAGEPVLARRSASGRTACVAVAHPAALAAPRVYRSSRSDGLVLFDGLPVAAGGELCGHDAGALADHWPRLPDLLEGQFTALRARLGDDEGVEALTDALGMSPLFEASVPGGMIVANTVAPILALRGTRTPDPVGVSTFLAYGWAGDDRTLYDGVRVVRGGTRLSLRPGRREALRHFSPVHALRAARSGPIPPADFVAGMVGLVGAAVSSDVTPVRCALTAGRDTRAVLALVRAAGLGDGLDYGTLGSDEEPDVRIARHIARELGLSHRAVAPDGGEVGGDPRAAIMRFLAITDGLSSLEQIADISDLADPLPSLGLQVTGIAGELSRTGGGPTREVVPYLPFLSGSRRFQARVMRAKVRPSPLLTPATLATVRDYVDAFTRARLAEGWRPSRLMEALFLYERVGRWGAAGVRRASARDDWFSPYCSRRYLEYALSLPWGEHFVERAHHRMLSLEPELRDLPYDVPWKPQRPRLLAALVVRSAVRYASKRLLARLRRGSGMREAEPLFRVRWLLEHREMHREQCLSHPVSPLWEWIDRAGLESALAAPAPSDEIAGGVLLRAVTLFWLFHGDTEHARPREPRLERFRPGLASGDVQTSGSTVAVIVDAPERDGVGRPRAAGAAPERRNAPA